jgi:hypothetical protein
VETYYLSLLQQADVAGFGSVVGHTNNALLIDAKVLWAGSFSTNPIVIDRAFGPWPGDGLAEHDDFYGKNFVFFATTNEWKLAVPTRPITETVIFDTSFAFENSGGYCAPKFLWSSVPMWFALETNDVEHLAFYSNIVHSIVIARDRARLYTTLRDVIKPDASAGHPYREMSFPPMWSLLWTSSEAELVAALNDPLLAPRLRARALAHLKTKYGWPEDSTIPEP